MTKRAEEGREDLIEESEPVQQSLDDWTMRVDNIASSHRRSLSQLGHQSEREEEEIDFVVVNRDLFMEEVIRESEFLIRQRQRVVFLPTRGFYITVWYSSSQFLDLY